MEVRSLYEMITYLQRGTKLHIGVCFFGNYGNDLCKLPHSHQIHSGQICERFKSRGKNGYQRCFKCRNLALKKALRTKQPFGGYCINGVYEYMHPVVCGNDVACVIFIGNVADESGSKTIREKLGEDLHLQDTMECGFEHHEFVIIAELIEGHIRTLLEKHTQSTPARTLNENIKNYIDSNLEFDISVTQISEIFHYNKAYLGRMFKKENNLTVAEYINLRRVEAAKELLQNSDRTVIDIANKVGFNTVTYFNKVFKKAVHLSPIQYRAQTKRKP